MNANDTGTLARAVRRFFTDDKGKVVIFQSPNAPLLIFFAATVPYWIISAPFNRIFQIIASAALIYWAWREITAGASPFRRCLGVVVLALLVVHIIYSISR